MVQIIWTVSMSQIYMARTHWKSIIKCNNLIRFSNSIWPHSFPFYQYQYYFITSNIVNDVFIKCMSRNPLNITCRCGAKIFTKKFLHTTHNNVYFIYITNKFYLYYSLTFWKREFERTFSIPSSPPV